MNKEDVIICVPLVTLIINKVQQYPNELCDYTLLGVYSGVTEEEIQDYLKLDQPKKFIVTYDSFMRLRNTIGDISGYHIIIDEFSELLSTYLGRETNISTFIDAIKELGNITYVSATPLKDEFLPDFMSELDIHIVD